MDAETKQLIKETHQKLSGLEINVATLTTKVEINLDHINKDISEVKKNQRALSNRFWALLLASGIFSGIAGFLGWNK